MPRGHNARGWTAAAATSGRQAQRALSEAAVDAARVHLAQAQIRAPAAARVLDREVEPGQIVQPGAPC
ncbi:MAG: hypothetical protein IPI03_23725 [Rubrivivax sp.]|nr:hypothetical protein [Rubrivivax sp.]